MILTFKSKDAEQLFLRNRIRRFVNVERVALRKLNQLHAAVLLSDMASPPGNHLEALKNDRQCQHSVRINDQWRICFRWESGNAYDVEIVDYH